MDASEFASYQKLVQDTTAANNAWSAEQAQKQMDFQERMANTAHQREVADLKAAGLNPILSAHSSGASSPAGAMADTDTSGTTALFGLIEKMVDTENAKAIAEMNNAARAARAASYAATSSKSEYYGSDPVLKIVQDFVEGLNGPDQTVKESIQKAGEQTRGLLANAFNSGKGLIASIKAGHEARKTPTPKVVKLNHSSSGKIPQSHVTRFKSRNALK